MASKSRLDNEQFLTQLSALFKKQAESGTVFLQQKRLTPFDPVENKHNPSPTDLSDITTPSKHSLIFRATDGAADKSKKTKITTVVDADKLDEFWKKYSEVVKSGITGLKKKDKKKTKGKKKKGVTK
ncbi:signal recognition particle, SRP14 subunit [Myxozyma melibiosi]|uniref:Signal recognition particle subunit SRP14 n=1 Tax=Myxozyma melibiosi TaxID=54550 RepID=A0ABR1FEI8_9ASCO